MNIQQMKQTQQQISWPELIITAEGLKEQFTEIVIKTLKQAFIENVYDIVWSNFYNNDEDITTEKIDIKVEELIRNNKAPLISEYLWKTPENQIEVVLNKEKINDDVIWEVMEIISNNLERLSNNNFVPLGKPLSFTSHELAHLFRQ